MFLNLLHHWQRKRTPQGGDQEEPVPADPQPVIGNDAKREATPEDPPADQDG